MENEKKLPKRKPPRWQERDYNTPGGYFITICTQDKRCILSRIVGGDVLDAPKSKTNDEKAHDPGGGDVPRLP